MNQYDKLKEFLSGLSIPKDEKLFTLNFCKRFDYINKLYLQMSANLNGAVIHSGFGNVNSKVMAVFESYKSSVNPFRDALEQFNIELWSIYTTFVNKTDVEYPKKYIVLFNEIYTIKPCVIYFVTSDKDIVENTINEFIKISIIPPEYYMVNPDDITDNPQDNNRLFNVLMHGMKYIDTMK